MKRLAVALLVSTALAVQPTFAPVAAQTVADGSSAPQAIPNAGLCVQKFGGQVALGVVSGGKCVSVPIYGAGFSTSLTYAALATLPIPAFLTSFYASGYATAGDLGRGMPMIVGTASGPLAKRGTDGRWWNLDAASLADIPIGFCGAVADDLTDNTAAGQTCAAIANAANVGNAASKPLRIRTNGGIMRLGGSGTISVVGGVVGDGRAISFVRNMNPSGNLFYTKANQSSPQYYGVHYFPLVGTNYSTTTAASNTTTLAVASTANITAGMLAAGTGIPGDVTVSSVSSSNGTVTLSIPSGATVNVASGATVTFSPAPTAGATIYIDAPSGSYAYNPDVYANFFSGQYVDVYCNRCNVPVVHDNDANDFIFADTVLDNVDFIDNGDQKYYGNNFFTGFAGAVGVLQYAAGGLIMTGNKGGGGAHAYRMALRSGAATSILFIHHNSFEGVAGSPILLTKSGSQSYATGDKGYFGTVSIFDNELANTTDDPLIDVEGGTWLLNVKTGRNHLVFHNADAAATGIKVNGALNFTSVDDNFGGFGGGTALYIAPGTIAHLGPITSLGVTTVCQCLSTSITYDGFSLAKIVPFPGSPLLSADAAQPSGAVSLPTFEYDPLVSSNNSSMFGDLTASGVVAGYSVSAATASIYDRTGLSMATLSSFQDPVASGSGPQPFAFAFSKPAANTSAVTISTTFKAETKGTAFIAKWVIKAGAGTFKTF